MDLKNDVIPVSELKARMKEVLARVARTGAPVLVTQNGHSVVLIVDVESFQKQQRKLEIPINRNSRFSCSYVF
jgi:prevent-host-death family protein